MSVWPGLETYTRSRVLFFWQINRKELTVVGDEAQGKENGMERIPFQTFALIKKTKRTTAF